MKTPLKCPLCGTDLFIDDNDSSCDLLCDGGHVFEFRWTDTKELFFILELIQL